MLELRLLWSMNRLLGSRMEWLKTIDAECLRFYRYPAGNHMFKGNNGNTRTRCEICNNKDTRMTPCTPLKHQETFGFFIFSGCIGCRSCIFIIFKHISRLVRVF